MTNQFILEIGHTGELKELPVQLLLQGYTDKLKVLIDALEVFFEPDEEGNYRVVIMSAQDEKQLKK